MPFLMDAAGGAIELQAPLPTTLDEAHETIRRLRTDLFHAILEMERWRENCHAEARVQSYYRQAVLDLAATDKIAPTSQGEDRPGFTPTGTPQDHL